MTAYAKHFSTVSTPQSEPIPGSNQVPNSAGGYAFAVDNWMRLDDALRHTRNQNFGGTDCALPMIYASERKISVDVFMVLTDSETWAGDIHPVQALKQYRQKTGIGAKLIVVGMVSNGFTIADPDDGGMMDVVGFDTSVPTVIADLARASG
jgi:60 kDa SS-A/Ro ribonucleoprotein